MDRREFISTFTVGLLATTRAAEAEQAGKIPRVGFLFSGVQADSSPFVAAFRQGLGGYVEGRTILIDYRWAEGKAERLPELAAELVRLKVDVMVTSGQLATRAAKLATATIPIVMVSVQDPVGTGIVGSLARPGGNITGFTLGISGEGFAGKWLEMLREAAPKVSHVAALWNPTNPASATLVRDLQAAARALNVRLDALDAGDPTKLDAAFAAIGASGVRGLIVTADPSFSTNRAKLVQFAANRRLPAIYYAKSFVDGGGLMAYGASSVDLPRKAAIYVDKILKGEVPGGKGTAAESWAREPGGTPPRISHIPVRCGTRLCRTRTTS